jgi:hypothetical protein
VAECTALYGNAYTSVGGAIDPPQPVGNIAATIQAPNLTITSGGQIQNVGNVIGTSVTLTGQKLINGITTPNTYTPQVSAPSQVISLSQINLPGLSFSLPGSVGATMPTPVAGKASYVTGSLAGSTLGALGPQTLLNDLPPNLQPSSTLFYFNPQAEDLTLQQAALQQTGQASFLSGLTYDSKNNLSVTEQEKAILYQNALNYAEQNNLQLGSALTQTQINALTQPMLWYVQQTVPDPNCVSTGVVTCPTVSALMPQVYLPPNWDAMSAGGNISGQNVTLNFNQDGHGSVLNTGTIEASNTLTVNTNTLTNQANQVNVGDIWQYIQATGYEKTSGTEVQPGGFMSAANMDLNVQKLNQIGGALQVLASDGTLNLAGTQQLLTSLQQQLGTNFTQTAVSDQLNSDFVAQGGFGFSDIVSLAFVVVVSIMSAGAATVAVGATLGEAAGSTFAAATATTSAGLGNIALSAAFAGFTSSIASQLTTTGTLNWGRVFEAAGVAGITAGLTNGITYGSDNGFGFTTGPLAVGGPVNSLAGLAGVNPIIGTNVGQASSSTATVLETRALAMLGEAGISAGVGAAVEGGSFGDAFKNALTQEVAAVAANAIGDARPDLNEFEYLAAHAALGCASSAALGTGCAGGAIGAAASAFLNPIIDGSGELPPAAMAALATLVGGTAAGLAGANPEGGVSAAQNETLNNWLNHVRPDQMHYSEKERYDNAVAACKNDGSDACQVRDQLNAVSQQRNDALASACAGGMSSDSCRSQVAAAFAAGNDVALVGGKMYAFDPTDPAIRAISSPYETTYAGSFDGQVAKSTWDALQAAPLDIPVLSGVGALLKWASSGFLGDARIAAPVITSLDSTANAAKSAVGESGGIGGLADMTAVSPSPSGFISNSKLNGNGYYLTDLTQQEQGLAQQIASGADSYGSITESLVDSVAQRQGWNVLSGGGYGSGNGFDHVIQNADGTVTILIDSKQISSGTLKLASNGSGGAVQMSDTWVTNVLSKLDSSSPAYLAVSNAVKNGTLVKGVAGVDRSTGNLVVLRVK